MNRAEHGVGRIVIVSFAIAAIIFSAGVIFKNNRYHAIEQHCIENGGVIVSQRYLFQCFRKDAVIKRDY
jgi:hypothetical protein